MVKPVLPDRVLESDDDRLLTDHLLERLRAILAGENLIAQGWLTNEMTEVTPPSLEKTGRPEGRSKGTRGTCEVRLTAAPFRV